MAAADYKKEFEDLVETVMKESASDLHLSVGRYPTIRVNGFLMPLMNRRILTKEDLLGFMAVVLSPEDQEIFLRNKEIDFSYNHHDKSRFR
ncbi:MAG TPA: type IV pili twitching motility protein PilT, partial [Candidatus Paceibacterota bacterium]|nr:type IV pili twitching motility protein PilT [Candidatus Paceibacterota bacterium]